MRERTIGNVGSSVFGGSTGTPAAGVSARLRRRSSGPPSRAIVFTPPALAVSHREVLRPEQPVERFLERDAVELERHVARLDDTAAELAAGRGRDLLDRRP